MTQSASSVLRRDADAPVVEEGAFAALGGEGLVAGRIVDQASHQLAVAFERDGDGEERDAVQEIGGAVERIDDEAVGAVGAFHLAALLEQEARSLDGRATAPCAGSPRRGCRRR